VLGAIVGAFGDAGGKIADQIITAGILGAIVIIYSLLSHAGKVPKFMATLKRRFKRLEFEWYRRVNP
jgi:hypothetical protein